MGKKIVTKYNLRDSMQLPKLFPDFYGLRIQTDNIYFETEKLFSTQFFNNVILLIHVSPKCGNRIEASKVKEKSVTLKYEGKIKTINLIHPRFTYFTPDGSMFAEQNSLKKSVISLGQNKTVHSKFHKGKKYDK